MPIVDVPEDFLFRCIVWFIMFILSFIIYGLYAGKKASYEEFVPLGRVVLFIFIFTFMEVVLGMQFWLSIIIAVIAVLISIPYLKGLQNINEIARKEKKD